MTGTNLADGRELSAQDFYTWLIEQGTNLAKRIVDATRQNYVWAMMQMLDAIMAPKILSGSQFAVLNIRSSGDYDLASVGRISSPGKPGNGGPYAHAHRSLRGVHLTPWFTTGLVWP